ncbi:ABC transporter permease subunit [Pseudalkalibacillus salsuginis]|uniref:ABC transporter permease subunit n=1 Tax=Pseudalkalibacillus salsuginis TaxID=2910972 RepID=UPI001F3CA8A6|nr:ABC transporter permease subunit [Pseudalkalibacillus salsuginis]MCF6411088.1 ABC transporter permease subunit [Pseudalkalibacillus salsuginis]
MSDHTSKPKKKRKLSESSTAYLLIAPSLLLILVIAIWPVIQSFYFSLFDLRLNNPTKSEVHTSHMIDLQRYLDNYFLLEGAIDNELDKADQGNAETLNGVKEDLSKLDSSLLEDGKIKERYEIIDEKLMNLEKVGSKEKLVEVEKDRAEEIQTELNDIEEKLKGLDELEDPKAVKGLSSALADSIIKPNFIGFDHYAKNLTDKRMWMSIWNTVVFTVVSVAIELVIGLMIALLINKAFFGRGLVRASILIPWAIPTVVAALMWKFLYDGQNGIVAKIFEEIGLVERMATLLTNDTGAMFSVIFADVWKTTPYMALLLLAGLQTIPTSMYEAAAIDGANKWKQFFTITLPLLKTSILVALLFRTLDAFRVFDLIFVLTGGGPANSTETISLLAYKVMIAQSNFGEGSALSVVVFICVAIISMIYISLLGRDLLEDKK